MSLEEFRCWSVFWAEIEPFGAVHDERRHANQVLATMNSSGNMKKAIKIGDVSGWLSDSPDFGTDKESSGKRIAAELMTAVILGGVPVKKGKPTTEDLT